MKKLIVGILFVVNTPLFAQDINTADCKIKLNVGVKINKELIEFKKNNQYLYRIEGVSKLMVSGSEVPLTSSQKNLVANYASNIRAVVPKVRDVAVEGISLAADGVTVALNEFLGKNNQITGNLTLELTSLSREIEQKLSMTHGIEIDENGETDVDLLDSHVEQHIEDTVKRVVENSMGNVLMAVGQQFIMSGGDINGFKTRMKTFEHQIERQMKSRTKRIKQKANEMCHLVKEIDQIETQIQHEISELTEIDAIDVTSHHTDKDKA